MQKSKPLRSRPGVKAQMLVEVEISILALLCFFIQGQRRRTPVTVLRGAALKSNGEEGRESGPFLEIRENRDQATVLFRAYSVSRFCISSDMISTVSSTV